MVFEKAFPDHHVYSPADLHRVATRAREAGAVALLTTEKDVVNLPPGWSCEIPLAACVIEMEIREADAFEDALLGRLEAVRMRA